MRQLFLALWLCIAAVSNAQEPQLHPTQVGLFGAGADAVFMSNPATGGGQWASKTASQSALNYWALSGTDVYRPSGDAVIVASADNQMHGYSIGSTATAIYGSSKMNLSTGEFRHTSGLAGWGGYHTWHGNGSERMILDAAGNVAIGGSTTANRLDVYGAICAGSASATSGNILLKSRYDAWPAQAIITEYSSGSIAMTAGMYQSGSNLWRSSFDYGAISKSALVVGYSGLRLLAAPAENIAGGAVLTTQPTEVFTVTTAGQVNSSSVISTNITATNTLATNYLMGGLGGVTVGLQSWNLNSSWRSGFPTELFRGDQPGGPGGVDYFHVQNFEYISRDGSGNATRIAWPYSLSTGSAPYLQTKYSGTASVWSKILCENISGRVLIGTTSDNGVDRLQNIGSAQITGAIKLGSATVGTISNGSASFNIWSKGTLTLPTQYASTPPGLGNGDIWTDLGTGTDHKLRVRHNDVTATVATREKDFAGGGSWAVVSANADIDSYRNARADGVTASFTLQGDLDMVEGWPYRYFFQRNSTNTITISAANMGGSIFYDGCSTVGGCSTMIAAQNTTYTITRIGTTLWVE
jgi:hypothetical protein